MDRNHLHCAEEVSGDVALRKESVDRNTSVLELIPLTDPSSLSARRAWIEIALLVYLALIRCRSPQGERG